MKSDTVTMVIKGIGFVGGAIATQYVNAIAQWANTGDWPARINWHVIIGSTVAAGFIALGGFMSGSYADWKKNRVDNNPTRTNAPNP